MNDILISFVIPFYNRYEMLREAIDSVTASGFKQTEVILIDDASQEDGLEAALAYFHCYNNVKYKRLETRQGPGNARNHALTLAEGEWVFFLDSDDVIYPDMLPKLASALQNECDADVMFFENSGFKYPDGHIEEKHVNFSPLEALPLDSLFRVNFFGQLWHYCFRRSFLDKYRIRCPDISLHEDFCFSLQSLCYARKTAVFPYMFHEYHVNSTGSINSAQGDPLSANQRIIEGHQKFYMVIKEMLDSGIDDSKKESLRTLLSHCILYLSPPPPITFVRGNSEFSILNCYPPPPPEYFGFWMRSFGMRGKSIQGIFRFSENTFRRIS
jgi:glycosyltransferase involved in cell wall biosynthesis